MYNVVYNVVYNVEHHIEHYFEHVTYRLNYWKLQRPKDDQKSHVLLVVADAAVQRCTT